MLYINLHTITYCQVNTYTASNSDGFNMGILLCCFTRTVSKAEAKALVEKGEVGKY